MACRSKMMKTGVGKCPNWTSPYYWRYNIQQIFERNVQNPQKGTFTNPCKMSPSDSACCGSLGRFQTDGDSVATSLHSAAQYLAKLVCKPFPNNVPVGLKNTPIIKIVHHRIIIVQPIIIKIVTWNTWIYQLIVCRNWDRTTRLVTLQEQMLQYMLSKPLLKGLFKDVLRFDSGSVFEAGLRF